VLACLLGCLTLPPLGLQPLVGDVAVPVQAAVAGGGLDARLSGAAVRPAHWTEQAGAGGWLGGVGVEPCSVMLGILGAGCYWMYLKSV
jgi:hypothetical protein